MLSTVQGVYEVDAFPLQAVFCDQFQSTILHSFTSELPVNSQNLQLIGDNKTKVVWSFQDIYKEKNILTAVFVILGISFHQR